MRYADMWPKDAKWWDAMKINPGRVAEFERTAALLIRYKSVYQDIENATAHDGIGHEGEGVPWPFLALTHLREAGQGDVGKFQRYLGNGQLLSRRTTIVPKGRGPFTGPNAFKNGALDALKVDGLSAVVDWRLEKMLFWMESFNGWGYAMFKGIPSPYIWGGTNIQKPGKYIADGRYSSTTVDPQPGCAPILATMMKLDPSITFTRES